ncbi:MAG: hypothetical protein IPK21_00005 [Haliscomenobacter sp.]|nr:hypothetical protein [Haliscomenobacter sp.]
MWSTEFLVRNGQAVFERYILRIGCVQFFKQPGHFFKKSQGLGQIAQSRVRLAEFGVRNGQIVFEIHILRIGVVQFFNQLGFIFKKSQGLGQIAQSRVRRAEFSYEMAKLFLKSTFCG